MIPDALRSRVMLSVGVAGHRHLDQKSRDAVLKTCTDVFVALGRALSAEHGKQHVECLNSEPLIRLLSPLAEGSDRLAALGLEAARIAIGAEQVPIATELVAVLPFPAQTYERDFGAGQQTAGASIDEFRTLLATAGTRVRLVGDDADRDDDDTRRRAYERAGRFILLHADLMIVIHDETRVAKRGGTAQMYREALDKGIPVIRIDPRNPTVSSCVAANGQASTQDDCVSGLVRRPQAAADGHAPEQIGMFAQSRWEWLERALVYLYRVAWSSLLAVSSPLRPRAYQDRLPDQPASAVSPFDAPYQEAQAFANRYAALYRGAFIINYVCGAGAVSFALHALLWQEHARLFGWIEAAILTVAGANFFLSRHRRWLHRFIHWRFLTEELRQMRVLHAIGITPPPAVRPLATHSAEHSDHGWLDRHFRNLIRSVGPPIRTLGIPDWISLVQNRWVAGQIRYHQGRLAQFMGAERLLHGLAYASFFMALVGCAGHLVAHSAHGEVGHWLEAQTDWLTFFAAGLPAWGAACHATAVEAEFTRMIERSHSMLKGLRTAEANLNTLGASAHVSLESLRQETFAIARLMLEEVTDWHLTHQPHVIIP